MPLIEGLGDEVTLIMGVILVCLVLTLAWFSTHTAELPALREVGITVIERTQIRRRVPRGGHHSGHHNDGNDMAVGNLAGLVEVMRQSGTGSASESSTEDLTTDDDAGGVNPSEQSRPTADGADAVEVSATAVTTAATPNGGSGSEGSSESSSTPKNFPSSATQGGEVLPSSIAENQSSEVRGSDKQKVGDNSEGAEQDSTLATKDSVKTNSELTSRLLTPEQSSEDEVRRRRVEYFRSSSTSLSDINQPTTTLRGMLSEPSDVQPSSSSTLRVSSLPGDTGDASASSPPLPNGQAANSQAKSEGSTSSTNTGSSIGEESQRIRVKLKYMNETQRLVHASPQDTIGDFRRTHFQQELQEGDKWVRFIFNGQDLRDDAATLQAYQVGDNCTMHCLITNKSRGLSGRNAASGGTGMQGGDDDDDESVLGAHMYPLFTLVLLVVWYFRLTYRQYFSPMSTVCLIGISFLLGLGYFSSLRNSAAANQRQPAGDRPAQRPGQPSPAAAGHAHAD